MRTKLATILNDAATYKVIRNELHHWEIRYRLNIDNKIVVLYVMQNYGSL